MRLNLVLGMVSVLLHFAALPLRAEGPLWGPFNPYSLLLAQPEPEPPPDLFAQAPAQGPSGSSNPGAGHPQMIGDLPGGIFLRRTMTFPTAVTLQVTTVRQAQVGMIVQNITTVRNIQVPGLITRDVNVPLSSRGPFKIGENESPLPMNRVFAAYNYHNDLAVLSSGTQLLPFNIPPLPAPPPSGGNGFLSPPQTTIRAIGVDPAPGLQRLDVHREVFGFERTLFGDNFSVGVRLPLIQQANEPTLESAGFGDVGVIFKYALINNRESGNVLSAGLMVTAPTGEEVIASDGTRIHPTLLQPFVGYFVNAGRFYLHGWTAAVLPTDSRDVTLWTNDAAVGYRLYRNESGTGLVRFITPTIEGHLTAPLNKRGARGTPGGFPDIFVATGGIHTGLGDRSTLTLGAATPLMGPQPFGVEGVVQFNLRF